MANINTLVDKYFAHINLPWQRHLSGAEKVIMAVYHPRDERRLRRRLGEFELATKRAGHGWVLCDLTDTFERWMANLEYRESYFEVPDDLAMAYEDLVQNAASRVRDALASDVADQDAVVALLGASSMFGFLQVSTLIGMVQREIRGRMLVFFPGSYDENRYRLLDARDGWNYQAVPITP